MRHGDEDNSPDVAACLPMKDVVNLSVIGGACSELLGRDLKNVVPNPVTGISDQRADEQAAHAVGDDIEISRGGIVAVGIEKVASVVDALAEEEGGVEKRCGRGIKVMPDLIPLAERGIAPSVVGYLRPDERGGKQTVDKQNRCFLRIVRFEQIEAMLVLMQ